MILMAVLNAPELTGGLFLITSVIVQFKIILTTHQRTPDKLPIITTIQIVSQNRQNQNKGINKQLSHFCISLSYLSVLSVSSLYSDVNSIFLDAASG